MAYCNNCGRELAEGDSFCAFCGQSQQDASAENTDNNTNNIAAAGIPQPEFNPFPTAPATGSAIPVQSPKKTKAKLALVFGIFGFITPCICACASTFVSSGIGLILSILAIIFACVSRKDTGNRFSGLAATGLVFGILGILMSLVMLVIGILLWLSAPYLLDILKSVDIDKILYDTLDEETAKTLSGILDALLK